jgi:hypothetical protein
MTMVGNSLEDIVKRLSIADIGASSGHGEGGAAGMPEAAGEGGPAADPRAEIKTKADSALALRDSLEHYTNAPPVFAAFLKRLMPVFVHILRGQCTFQSESHEQVREQAVAATENNVFGGIWETDAVGRDSAYASSKHYTGSRNRRPRRLSRMPQRRSSC